MSRRLALEIFPRDCRFPSTLYNVGARLPRFRMLLFPISSYFTVARNALLRDQRGPI